MRKIILFLSLMVSSFAFAQTCPAPAQLVTDMTTATQASTVSLDGVNPVNCPEVSMSETWSGGKLIFSDSPESPTTTGRLYDDATLGPTGANNNRVFYYHVNGKSSGSVRMTVLLKNLGSSSGTLTIQKKGTAGPSTSYLYVGKMAFDRYLTSTAGSPTIVPAGSIVRFDSSFDSNNISPASLVNGIYDYSFNQNHEVIVCVYNTKDNPVSVCPGMALLARDTHVRATFPNSDKTYDTAPGVSIDTANGVQSFPIADGTNDTDAVGTDVTDGSQQINSGNYGILYHMHLSTTASDGQNLGFLFNPRGGAWGGATFIEGGLYPQGTYLMPPSTGSLGDSTKGVVAGEYGPGSGFTVWLQFMPTGGSSFPLKFVAVPF